MEAAGHITQNALPALIVAVPLLSAALVRPLGKWNESVRNVFVTVVTGITLLMTAGLIPLIAEHHKITYSVPAIIGELTFTVDSFNMLFALFSAFVWFCSTLYSLDYLKHEKKHDRYHITNLVVLAAMLGVVLAGDLITLYLSFEALGLVAYLFVVHTETDEAKKASIKYFWMTVLGGFALIGGIFITYALGGTGAIGPIPVEHGATTLRWVAFVLLTLGFGVKAGMLPVHVWLPDAHPVAPSPASALLSGVMIKAGAYGIFRTVTALFRPELAEEIAHELWHFTGQIGLVVLWIGIATMFIGVVLALGQSNAKRMLAYHSVSQMGFILAGIGAAGYLGAHGALGYAGGLYHIVNHALFKACLFLGVGAVFFRTGSLDMYHLGGLWKKMPLTFLFTLIAACGITGVPLFNGFVSKCLIHHSLVEAWELHELVSLGIAEKIYIVTCGGTACSFIKLIGLVFLGKPKVEYGPKVKDAPPRMLIAMGMLAAAIITLGVRPQIVLEGVVAPGLHTWGLHSDLIEHYLEVSFMSWGDIMSVVTAFAIGFTVFFVGMRFGLFHMHAPKWFGVDFWYRKAARGFMGLCRWTDEWYELLRGLTSKTLRWIHLRYRAEWSHLERDWRRTIMTVTTGAPGPRNQHFVQRSYVILEREKQATVRYAVMMAVNWLREHPDEADDAYCRGLIDAVRDISSYMATRLFKERLGVVSDFIRSDEADAVRDTFERVVCSLSVYREAVGQTALTLAEKRMAGENPLREISAAMNRILSEERFDQRLRQSVPEQVTPTAALLHATHGALPTAPSAARLTSYRVEGLSRLERAGTWVTDMARLIVESATQERVSWMIEDRSSTESVLKTRRQIQRYARDMSFNVAVVLIVLLVFLASLSANF
ncbi:MAG: NADH dehydrogenase [Coriobacteriia bacterium]|nr:NADH dehydrogenase [Coriobacteriia bacterium]MBN2822175.1 NADH dehydrogenase [Coriobacteriia bacterium]